MINRICWPVLVLFFSNALSGCFSSKPVSFVHKGIVTKVHDGDSIHLTPAGEKRVIIRLAAIDAPEISQQHGIESRDYLRTLIMNRQVSAQCNKRDKYQRHVCVVFINGEDANLAMLKAGQAWYYERFRNEQSAKDQRTYRRASDRARKNSLGLWSSSVAIPPWEYRAQHKN